MGGLGDGNGINLAKPEFFGSEKCGVKQTEKKTQMIQVPRVLWFLTNCERLRGISVINNNARALDRLWANQATLFLLIKVQITANMPSAHWNKISLLARK
jgi:hypothetical protein